MLSNVAVIIRSVGERTEALCTHLVKQQVPESHVVVIHERPFSQAVRRSFEIGLDFGLDWTLCVDADVLIREGAITALIQAAADLPETTFTISGIMVDKLLGHTRVGGGHLYRTQLCENALQFISESEAEIRPETFVKTQMAERGYPYIVFDSLLIAIHDFEQYFSDIYRKAIIHTKKHATQMPYASAMWQRLMSVDQDYRIALWGYRLGKAFDGAVRIDRDIFPEHIDTLLRLAGIEEKRSLTMNSWDPGLPERVIAQYVPPPEYLIWSRLRSLRKRRLGRLRAAITSIGPWRAIPWLVGGHIQAAGESMQRWATRGRGGSFLQGMDKV